MKKVCMMMVVTAITTLTQAASIDWQSGNLFIPTYFNSMADYDGTFLSGTSNRVGVNQVTAYYFLVTETQYNGLYGAGNDLSLKDYVHAEMVAGTYDYKTGASNVVKSQGATNRVANWIGEGDYAIGETGYMLAIFVLSDSHGTDWFIVNVASETIPASGNDPTAPSIASGIGVWTPVPEPATMALVGIGIVAFGLRRRQK